MSGNSVLLVKGLGLRIQSVPQYHCPNSVVKEVQFVLFSYLETLKEVFSKLFKLKSFLEGYRASLVAQMVKNPPVMQETQVPSLEQEDPLEKEMATHSSIPAWEIPAWQATVCRVAKSWTPLSN